MKARRLPQEKIVLEVVENLVLGDTKGTKVAGDTATVITGEIF